MFSRKISDNYFCDKVGDELFPHITAESYKDDYSLVATMRALLGTRTTDTVKALRTQVYLEDASLMKLPEDFHGILLAELVMDADNVDRYLAGIAKDVEENAPDFHVVKDLGKFATEKAELPSLFCVSEEKKQTIIYVYNLDVPKYHFLQSFITRLLPWYFEEHPLVRKGEGVVDQEAYKVILACSGRNPEEYEKAIVALYDRYEFRDAIIRIKLDGFEEQFHRAQLEGVKRDRERIMTQIKNLESQFRDYYQSLDDITTREAGLIQKIASGEAGDSTIRDYFLANKYLHLEYVSGNQVTFTVATIVSNFNPEVFESTVQNEHAFWYRSEAGNRYNRDISDEQIELLIRALFEKEICKLKICASFTLDFATGGYQANPHHEYGPEFVDYMPNMHIQEYACLGSGHSSQLREAMLHRDYIGALNTCMASAANISMEELPTGEKHMKYLLGNKCGKVIILPTGEEVTAKEAIKWLEENEGGDAA